MVNRFNPTMLFSTQKPATMHCEPNGAFVKYEDYAALRAQLADAGKVKDLEWVHEEARKHWPESWSADTSVGVYTIEHNPDEDPDFRYSLLLGEDGEHFSQLDEAMDRAQELFQGCILGGLSALEGE